MDWKKFGEDANKDKIWKAGDLPTDREQVLQNLEHHGENENFLRVEAYKWSIDFDDHYDHMDPEPLEPEN
jgi:hypothetical protein